MVNVLGNGDEPFDFKQMLEKLDLDIEDFNVFLENEGESFSDYSEENIQKIYILQEMTLANMRELGIKNNQLVGDAMANLCLNI